MFPAAANHLCSLQDEGVNACSECILFTMNESTLNVIEKYDKHVKGAGGGNLGEEFGSDDGEEFRGLRPQLSMNTWTRGGGDGGDLPERPSTASRLKKKKRSKLMSSKRSLSDDTNANKASPSFIQSEHVKLIIGGQRKELQRNKSFVQPKKGNSDIDLRPKGNISMRPSTAPMRRQWKGRKGRHLEFLVSGNWGAPQPAIGLSGLEVLDAEFNKIEIAPRLISMMGTYVNYNCSMLLNENKITSDPNEMWIVEVANDGEVSIHIDLGMEYDVGGLKVWNYNAGQEERCEGGGASGHYP